VSGEKVEGRSIEGRPQTILFPEIIFFWKKNSLWKKVGSGINIPDPQHWKKSIYNPVLRICITLTRIWIMLVTFMRIRILTAFLFDVDTNPACHFDLSL
jgi:hypothetical protein